MGRARIICLGLVAMLLGVSLATGTAVGFTATSISEPGFVEAGFRLHGSHGYSISVVAYSGEEGHSGTIEFIARRRGASAIYSAPASVTADAIRADLGRIGSVDVLRRPSGLERTVHPKCLGSPITYERAAYEGVIEFNGEEGYTRAREDRVTQLPAVVMFAGQGPCGGGYGEASGPGEPGARLRGISFAHGRSLSFQLNKNSPQAQTVLTASLKERRGGIRIDRELAGTASPSAFRFDQYLRTARVSPQAPFSGSAVLHRSKDQFFPVWTGDLKLAFPGHSIPLAGPEVHVSLVHARFTRSRGPNAEIGF